MPNTDLFSTVTRLRVDSGELAGRLDKLRQRFAVETPPNAELLAEFGLMLTIANAIGTALQDVHVETAPPAAKVEPGKSWTESTASEAAKTPAP